MGHRQSGNLLQELRYLVEIESRSRRFKVDQLLWYPTVGRNMKQTQFMKSKSITYTHAKKYHQQSKTIFELDKYKVMNFQSASIGRSTSKQKRRLGVVLPRYREDHQEKIKPRTSILANATFQATGKQQTMRDTTNCWCNSLYTKEGASVAEEGWVLQRGTERGAGTSSWPG